MCICGVIIKFAAVDLVASLTRYAPKVLVINDSPEFCVSLFSDEPSSVLFLFVRHNIIIVIRKWPSFALNTSEDFVRCCPFSVY